MDEESGKAALVTPACFVERCVDVRQRGLRPRQIIGFVFSLEKHAAQDFLDEITEQRSEEWQQHVCYSTTL